MAVAVATAVAAVAVVVATAAVAVAATKPLPTDYERPARPFSVVCQTTSTFNAFRAGDRPTTVSGFFIDGGIALSGRTVISGSRTDTICPGAQTVN